MMLLEINSVSLSGMKFWSRLENTLVSFLGVVDLLLPCSCESECCLLAFILFSFTSIYLYIYSFIWAATQKLGISEHDFI